VLLSGECSDEIFGGYPWFYRPEMLERDFFPWVHDPHTRIGLFDRELVKPEQGMEYMREVCRQSTRDCPLFDGECAEDATARR
jgi:asparagine synthase (glutamine-hydrolysing)